MRAFWTLFRRELHGRRMLFAASLAMGLLVAVLPYFDGARGFRAQELRGAAAVGVALIWSLLLALVLGATCLARDLGERRLAFDFRLPAAATSLWAVRLFGAFVSVLIGAGLVIALPSAFGCDFAGVSAGIDFLARPAAWQIGMSWIRAGVLLWLPAGVFALLLLSNLGGLALFGHRRWSGLDLASLLLVVGFCLLLESESAIWGDLDAGRLAIFALLSLTIAGLLLASWRQVSEGRTEPSRAHAWAAATTFAVAVAGAGGSALLAYRYVHPCLDDVDSPARARVFGSETAALSGHVSGRAPTFRFLVDRRTGEALRLGPVALRTPTHGREESWLGTCAGDPGCSLPLATKDGSTIVWLAGERNGLAGIAIRAFELSRESGDLAASPTGLTWPAPPIAWALSSDGREIATRWPGPGSAEPSSRIVVDQLATGGTTRVLEIDSCGGAGPINYVHPDRLLVACGPAHAMLESLESSRSNARAPTYSVDLREIHLPSGTIRTTGGWLTAGWLAVNPHAYLRALQAPGWILQSRTPAGAGSPLGWELVTPHTGRPVREFLDWGNPYRTPTPVDGLGLSGGRILVVLEKQPSFLSRKVSGRWVSEETNPGRSEVLVLTTSGETIRSFRFEKRLSKILAVDERGALLLGDRRNWDPYSGQSPVAYRLDLDNGALGIEEVPGTDLPHVVRGTVGIATRQRNRNWRIQSPTGQEMLFTKPNPAWGEPYTNGRSTGQESTSLKRR